MFFDIITYLPMFTALFWAIMLLINKDKGESAKTLLGTVMIAIFLLDLSLMFFYQNENKLYIYADPFNTCFSISSFLLLFWYIKLLTKEPKIQAKNLWLLTPGLFFALTSTVLYILMSPPERTNYIDNFMFNYGEFKDITPLIRLKVIDFIASKVAFIVAVTYSIIKCLGLIKKYNQNISNYYSNLNEISINWVKNLIYGLIFVGIISILVNTFSQPFMLNANLPIAAASLFFSVIIYTIGYFGFKQDYNISNLEPFVFTIKEEAPPTVIKNTDELQILAEKITKLFEIDKTHRKQDLKISDLSTNLNTNRSYISKVINTHFNCSFIEFVNNYRIKDAKKLFASNPDASIIEISHLAGFNSASTFTRVFKQHTGESPSIYRKKIGTGKESKI